MTRSQLRPRCLVVIALATLTIAVTDPVMGQVRTFADPTSRQEAMERLSFLVGEWTGDAWAITGPEARHDLRQTESVRYALAGQVLLVEGVGREVTDGVGGDTLFHAVATIDWLPDRGYLLRSYTLNGQYGEFPLDVTERGYSWAMDLPGGTVRYRMQLLPDGGFEERGWFTPTNGREVETFGMLLHRTSAR